jgi:hypothetical protein
VGFSEEVARVPTSDLPVGRDSAVQGAVRRDWIRKEVRRAEILEPPAELVDWEVDLAVDRLLE